MGQSGDAEAISLDVMGVFAWVAERGSFSAAARELAMPKQTVSRWVAELEQRLGVQLLHRATRRSHLTDAGREYAERCREIARLATEAKQSLGADRDLRGISRVTADPLFGEAFLAPLLLTLRTVHPLLSVEVTLLQRQVDLIEEGFDVAFRVGELSDSITTPARRGYVYTRAVAPPRNVRCSLLELCAAEGRGHIRGYRGRMDDKPGKLLAGKYELTEPIGSGGMATVWRGLTRGASGFVRPVAIKRMHPHLYANDVVVALFVEEARVGAGLCHPNIVQVHDFGEDEEGLLFLVTELVDGIDLHEYVSAFQDLRSGPPWQIVSALAVEVLKGLDAAHARVDHRGRPAAVLHRDVTPQNILLDVSGVVKLADFGMARAMDRGRMTQPDMVKGKLSYLAPEMILGADPSIQSDVFGLGVVLWEALASRRLFDAPTDFEVIEKLKNPRVPMLSMQRTGLPLALTTLIHRALELHPERRFSSARDMAVALSVGLRSLPEPVDQRVLARSFRAARDQLGKTTRLEFDYATRP